MGRNPIQSAGCYAVLKSLQDNPDSALEAIDFAVSRTKCILSTKSSNIFTGCPFASMCHSLQGIAVNQEFQDLYVSVKEIFPTLVINHGGRIGTFTKADA